MERVVITGLGAVSPIGNNVEEFWNSMKNDQHGIGPITRFDNTDWDVQVVAEVKDLIRNPF